MNLDYLELIILRHGTDYVYRIDGKDIVMLDLLSKSEKIDCSLYNNFDIEVDLIDSFLLVANNYEGIIKQNHDSIHKGDIITQVIVYKNDSRAKFFVSTSNYNHNKGQIIQDKNNKIYISIDDTHNYIY